MASSDSARATWADPIIRARRLAAIAAARKPAQDISCMQAARHMMIPTWVPDDLADEYREIAVLEDEHAAARHCRRLKREAAEPDRAFRYAS